eukprot:CAMPEP_0202693308 /NCGR_PEP_ID=MMETSP1385-20130828/7461_1 /ASSEMBLY_ACC=CAM_ASM_000861 /TAXON_ID=933848 /ORGANISM="Elphidium margaritaceum" /LENGTH=507 /DNA_ID=CAMNT_0049348969 /DNA_START=33 /DNA_END=1552 /DNA_ORIENTATION=+
MGAGMGCCTHSDKKSEGDLQRDAQINIQRVDPATRTSAQSADETEYVSHRHRDSISDLKESPQLRASRRSFDDSCAERNGSDGSASSDSVSSEISAVSMSTDDAHRQHRSRRKSSHKSHHKSKSSSKSRRNKLISALKEVIRDFNGSMQSISVLQMFGAKGQQHTSAAITHTHFDQMEMLDEEHICKYFKTKCYNVDWFLITPREKFICVMVNKWPNYSILTVAKIYELLQVKISDLTPCVSPSSTDLFSKNKKLSAMLMMQPSSQSRKDRPNNISFVWKTTVSEIVDCDANHFLYLASLVIKNINQDILKQNSLATQMIQTKRPMLDQLDILTYFMDIQMNGYLFRHLHKHVFRRNVTRVLFDTEHNEQLVLESADRLHAEIDRFDVSRIYCDELCVIEFSSKNSKRWESVSSLIKGMKLSEYDVSVGIDDDSDGVDDDEHGSPRHRQRTMARKGHETEEEKQKEPDMQQTMQEMKELRNQKQTMPQDDYIRKLGILQQKLEQSMR